MADTNASEAKFLEAAAVFTAFLEGKQDAKIVLQSIGRLQGVPVTTSILLTTKAGVPLKKLTRSDNEEIKAAALKLQTYWMDTVNAETEKTPKRKRSTDGANSEQPTPPTKKLAASQETPSKLKKSNDSTTNDKPQPVPVKSDEKKVPNKTTGSNSGRVPGVIPTAITKFEGKTNDKQRNMFQSKFFEAFGPCLIPGGLETSLLAEELENELWAFSKGDKREYAGKFRTLYTNLADKDNEGLREALFVGDLTVQQLMLMPSEELANPKLKMERKELEEYVTACRKPQKQEATCESFTCSKCKQNKTTYYQLQTRSADEPMTTFVQCVNCGNRWKFC